MLYDMAGSNNLRRSLRKARMYIPIGTRLVPRNYLVDPVVIDVLGDAFLWRGYETKLTELGIAEYEQLWLLRQRTNLEGPALPAFDVQKFVQQLPEIYVRPTPSP